MKDLYWKVLDHLDNYDHYDDPDTRSKMIDRAQDKIRKMDPLELLETISDVFEKEHHE